MGEFLALNPSLAGRIVVAHISVTVFFEQAAVVHKIINESFVRRLQCFEEHGDGHACQVFSRFRTLRREFGECDRPPERRRP
jgi:hypothetical protein